MERFKVFKSYVKDVLLLTRLSYNVGVGRLLGYGKQGKSKLLCKIEQGDRDFHKDYLPFATIKARSCVGYSDAGRRSVFCFMSPNFQSIFIVRVPNSKNLFLICLFVIQITNE